MIWFGRMVLVVFNELGTLGQFLGQIPIGMKGSIGPVLVEAHDAYLDQGLPRR